MLMGSDMADTARMGLARRINDLSATELHEFVRNRLNSRELHHIVRQLNDIVMSKAPGQSGVAREALDRLGFVD